MDTTFFIKSLPFFDGVSDSSIRAFLSSAKIKTYPKKSPIYIAGDKADRFFIVLSGWVKLHQTTMDGSEVVLALFTRGDIFGEAILIDGASYPHSAEALKEAKIIEFPVNVMKSMVAENPEVSMHLMQSMTQNIQRLQLENEHLAVMTTAQRVGCFLLQMCLSVDHCDGHITFPYDKHLAAVRLGMKPETFSRALKDLQKIGIKTNSNDIFIESLETLEEFCCCNCSCSPENCLLVKQGLCSQHDEKQRTA